MLDRRPGDVLCEALGRRGKGNSGSNQDEAAQSNSTGIHGTLFGLLRIVAWKTQRRDTQEAHLMREVKEKKDAFVSCVLQPILTMKPAGSAARCCATPNVV